jgi:hypothetical protein
VCLWKGCTGILGCVGLEPWRERAVAECLCDKGLLLSSVSLPGCCGHVLCRGNC